MPAVDTLLAGGASVVETGSAAAQKAPSVTAMAGRAAPVMLTGVASPGTAGRLIARSISGVETMPRLTGVPSERAAQSKSAPSQQAPGRAAGPGAAETAAETDLRRRENTVLPASPNGRSVLAAVRPPNRGGVGGNERLPVTVGNVRAEVQRDELPSPKRGQERMALPVRRASRAESVGAIPASPAIRMAGVTSSSHTPGVQVQPAETVRAGTSVTNAAMAGAPEVVLQRQPARERSPISSTDAGLSDGSWVSGGRPPGGTGGIATPRGVETLSAVSGVGGFLRTRQAVLAERRTDLARSPVRGASPAVQSGQVTAGTAPSIAHDGHR